VKHLPSSPSGHLLSLLLRPAPRVLAAVALPRRAMRTGGMKTAAALKTAAIHTLTAPRRPAATITMLSARPRRQGPMTTATIGHLRPRVTSTASATITAIAPPRRPAATTTAAPRRRASTSAPPHHFSPTTATVRTDYDDNDGCRTSRVRARRERVREGPVPALIESPRPERLRLPGWKGGERENWTQHSEAYGAHHSVATFRAVVLVRESGRPGHSSQTHTHATPESHRERGTHRQAVRVPRHMCGRKPRCSACKIVK
jgi:hypothetical protein